MTTTLTEIASFLAAEGLRHELRTDRSYPHIEVAFSTERYRNGAGEPTITLIVELTDDDQNVFLFAPRAFKIAPGNLAAVALACCVVQYNTTALQFEIDHKDGEVRPTVEIPLADALLTRKQLMMGVGILLSGIEKAAALIRHAAQTGEVAPSLYGDTEVVAELSHLLAAFTPEQVQRAVGRRAEG